ncbi:helix-turn-helix transcriptional regulator [Kribbella swartbergensis]
MTPVSGNPTESRRRAAVLPEMPSAIPHDYAVPPGELIRDELAARGLNQAELAARTGLSTKHVNQVVKAVVPLSIDTALKIERAIGLSAHLLMTMEAHYQSNHGREVARQHLAAFQAWFRRFSRSDLVARGVVDAHADIDLQIEQLLFFFGVASPDAYDHVYSEAALSFRRAQHLTVDRDATALWLRLGERQAEALDPSPFDREAFVRLVFQLPDLTRLPIGEEANDYARQVLLRSRQDEVLRQVRTKSQAVAVADQLGIDPGIVAGQSRTRSDRRVSRLSRAFGAKSNCDAADEAEGRPSGTYWPWPAASIPRVMSTLSPIIA